VHPRRQVLTAVVSNGEDDKTAVVVDNDSVVVSLKNNLNERIFYYLDYEI
jgi:hypothetical protein